MLRPDFTVPVVQMHMAEGADPARYTYSGEVFRRQENAPERPSEYLQVGFEIFERDRPAEADAEVFAGILAPLHGLDLRIVTGDIGLLLAAVRGLRLDDARRGALLRHLWRPRRFRALLDRFSGRAPVPPGRQSLLAAEDPFAAAGPHTGKRSRSEIAARIDALRAEAAAPKLSLDEVSLLDALLAVKETCPFALTQLRDISVDLPSVTDALDGFEARLEAITQRGIDVAEIAFEGSFGRTSMEYYDGFVFGVSASARPDLPALATGGRYDALTQRLGEGRSIPAVGGVIRPDVLATIKGEPT